MEILTWIATTIAIIGSILNAKQKISGFFFWLVSNFMYLVINVYLNIWAQAALFAFNIFVCIMGVCQWKQKTK